MSLSEQLEERERKRLAKKNKTNQTPRAPSVIQTLVTNLEQRITSLESSLSDIQELKFIAVRLAGKYARTKKRWFSGSNVRKGLSPNNQEPDKLEYERLLKLCERK